LKSVILAFEVHQPFRIRRNYFWERRMFRRLKRRELFDYYFDSEVNREIFERASRRCYFPSNQILLKAIDEWRREKKRVKVSFSISGVFLEQCERFGKDVLESFKQLAETGCVEFIGQTYYHSLAGLYPAKDEFIEQVRTHRRAIGDLFNAKLTFFENTELLYNNEIAKTVARLGFRGMFTEGAERILEGRSPNHMYSAKGCGLRLLLRNYRLTDDIGFRFSARWWSEWPLTADKYASWLESTPGVCVTIFPDYETFGEHHWPETGIHDFLAHLLREINQREGLEMATPSEAMIKSEPVGEIDVSEVGGTVSWADLDRDTKSWIGNAMQWAYYRSARDMEPMVRESQDTDLLRLWRHFQTSDHLYYMYTAGGGPGEVHSYFNPFGNPFDAFITCHTALMDFEHRLRDFTLAANEPFKFYTDVGDANYTGLSVLSLRGLLKTLPKVSIRSLEFHNSRGDLKQWAESSLMDAELGNRLGKLADLKGEGLRRTIIQTVRECLKKRGQSGLEG